jgi:hypothetical protein
VGQAGRTPTCPRVSVSTSLIVHTKWRPGHPAVCNENECRESAHMLRRIAISESNLILRDNSDNNIHSTVVKGSSTRRGLTRLGLVQLRRKQVLKLSESFGNVAPRLCQSRDRYSLSSGMPRASTYREQSYPGSLIPVPGNGLSTPRCLCFLPCM